MINDNSTPDSPDIPDIPRREGTWFRSTSFLLQVKVTTGIRSRHFWIITVLFAAFAYIYYGVLTAYHDVYVILFFYPLIYASLVYRLRGVIISGLIVIGILLPHALLFASDSLLLVRTLLFALFAFLVSSLGATLLNYLERHMEAYQEILSLNEVLNNYIERLKKTQQQLIQAAKLGALGQLSAAMAHELNNPLAGILVYVKLLGKKISDGSLDKDKAAADLAKIEVAVNYCSGIIRSLLDFARQSEPVLKLVEVDNVIEKAIALVSHQAEMKKIIIEKELKHPLPQVLADFNQLQQVFVNFAVNAIQAMGEGGRLIILGSSQEDGWVMVAFKDTGYGIPAENMDKIFTPFFTTKEEVKGVGLGLAVSYGIIERHGGRIDVQSEPGKGSTFTVYLPVGKQKAKQT